MAAWLDDPGELPVELEEVDIHRGLVCDDAVEGVVRKICPQHVLKVKFHLTGTAALLRKPLRELDLVRGNRYALDKAGEAVVQHERGTAPARPGIQHAAVSSYTAERVNDQLSLAVLHPMQLGQKWLLPALRG